ncbi:MAG TPA: hypothetical protein VE684_19055 [Crenalkalicoccus sp.]|jgi:predicted DNA-binding helix-hairpin-helix protein|nr:hypothetical protein [Crenalkalicoccus sp.]
MELNRKSEILAEAAKHEASCAASGTGKWDRRKGGPGMGARARPAQLALF